MENFLLSEEKLDSPHNVPKRLEDDIDMFQDIPSDNEVKIYNNANFYLYDVESTCPRPSTFMFSVL